MRAPAGKTYSEKWLSVTVRCLEGTSIDVEITGASLLHPVTQRGIIPGTPGRPMEVGSKIAPNPTNTYRLSITGKPANATFIATGKRLRPFNTDLPQPDRI